MDHKAKEKKWGVMPDSLSERGGEERQERRFSPGT